MPRRVFRTLLAAQLAVVLAAVPLVAYRWTHLGRAFSTPYWAGSVQGLGRPVPVGQVMWLSIGNVPVRLHEPVTVTGVRVLASPALRPLQGARLRFDVHGGFGLLEDRYFSEYGFVVDGPFVGTVLAPGEPAYFGAVRVVLSAPGAYRVRGFRISYRDSSGRRGAQTVPVDYRFTVAAGAA